MIYNLKEKYHKEIAKKLGKEFGIKNIHAVPVVKKIVVNSGVGELAKDKGKIKAFANEIADITGQKPSVRKARISVAGFSLRKGMPVGLKVTLRGERMYQFLDKVVSIVLPRLRDFRGLSVKSFDKQANYTFGLADHTVFTEIDLAKTLGKNGIEITVVTSTNNKDQSKRLLELMGMPFEKI